MYISENQMNHYSRSLNWTWLKIVLGIHELWNLEIASARYRRHHFTILKILTLTWKIIWIIILEVSNRHDMTNSMTNISQNYLRYPWTLKSRNCFRYLQTSWLYFTIIKILTLTLKRIWIIILEASNYNDGLIPYSIYF